MTAHLPVERSGRRPNHTTSLHLFLSYCRHDEALAAAIARDLSDVGIDVWRDERLSGGQAWWDTILESIQDADGVVFVLSASSLDSLPCSRELGYAQALGKAILPIRVDDTAPGLAPPALASLEWVDYDPDDRTSVIRLMRAVTSIPPAPPLPDPLPPAPAVPLSYTTNLAALVHQPEELTAHEQHSLLFQLREGLDDEGHRDECAQLLRQLRSRRELLASVERQIDEALHRHGQGGTAATAARVDLPPPPPPPVSPPPGPAATPPAADRSRPHRLWLWVGLAVGVVVLAVVGLVIALGSPSPPITPQTYGDDATLDALWDGCGAGDMAACDTLYFDAPVDTDYEDYGSTCGLTREETFGGCTGEPEVDGEEPMVYGDDPALDALWDACVAGDLAACDTLYYDSPVGSEYELKGSYCGGLSTEPMSGSCDGG